MKLFYEEVFIIIMSSLCSCYFHWKPKGKPDLKRVKEVKQSKLENDNMKKFVNAIFIREAHDTEIRWQRQFSETSITVFYATNFRCKRVKIRSNFEEKDFHLVVYQKKPCCVEMPLKVTSATKR